MRKMKMKGGGFVRLRGGERFLRLCLLLYRGGVGCLGRSGLTLGQDLGE